MSLSASDNAGFTRASGKTPPPAPSAAFAKRARELQADERLGSRYIPPALRAMASGGSPSNDVSPSSIAPADISPLPPSNLPPGFRRARAGTLPSNVQLAAAQRFAGNDTLNELTTTTPDTFLERQPAQTHIPSATASLLSVTRPGLRHSSSIASSAAASAVTERNSRLRSGSLTLPNSGLSNAFGGSSIFSTSWLTGNQNGALPGLDEIQSVTSMDSPGDSFQTLAYLDVDDNIRNPPPATLSELRSQAQAAIAGRLRSQTVSNPYRLRGAALSSSLLATPNADDMNEEYVDDYVGVYGQRTAEPYDGGNLGNVDIYSSNMVPKGFKQTQLLSTSNGSGVAGARPRAISVGVLDDPSRSAHRLVSALEHHQDNYTHDLLNLGSKLAGRGAGLSAPGIGSRASSYLTAPASQTRALSPKTESSNNQTQTPTRSLWIGNLDSSVTSEQLIHVFAPYGAIESLRLLPEKECGFVNFVDQADAIRAKDDVLNRLGGQIGMPNSQAVRIGFGKAESAPVAPSKSSANAPVSSAASNAKSNANSASGSMAGFESQLQSTPTRALWIGSIPSTTTPAQILSVFSPYGPIESARVLTHKNCGFINFERLDDAVRARKALNGRDVLGTEVGAIRIGFAKVPVKGSPEGSTGEEGASSNVNVQGVGELSVGATIHTLRGIKGASTIPADEQVLGGAIENYRSNLLLSMIGSGGHVAANYSDGVQKPAGWTAAVTEQQMIMKELSDGSPDAEQDIAALADFRPPMMYYTSIPLVTERPNNRRWDATKLRDLRKRLDSGTLTTEEIDEIAAEFVDGEIIDLASDWLGNTVVQKLFERCSPGPRFAMLERVAPHLAMIGIHKNGTWAAQKIIECVHTPEEISLVAQNLRPYAPPLLLDQFGNYVVQCCLRFGSPANDFIFDAMVDRLWEVAQGRFGARSMRTCLESNLATLSQQRRIATAIVLNSIPLATNPNGALLLTWLLDTSGFPNRYRLLAPRFTPHLSHLCTHKLASLTVLRIVNQKVEPDASLQIVRSLFFSTGDHVLTDVLGDQVNGVTTVHKVLTSPFIDPKERMEYLEATKRVLLELKVVATQAYRRLIDEVGLPVTNFQPYGSGMPPNAPKLRGSSSTGSYNSGGMSPSYAAPTNDQNLASMMAALQMGGQSHVAPQLPPPQQQQQQQPQMLEHQHPGIRARPQQQQQQYGMNMSSAGYSGHTGDQFNPFGPGSPDPNSLTREVRHNGGRMIPPVVAMSPPPMVGIPYGAQSPSMGHQANVVQNHYGMAPQAVPPHLYQAYMYQMYQQPGSPNLGYQP